MERVQRRKDMRERHPDTERKKHRREKDREERRGKKNPYSHAIESPRVSSKTVLGLIRKLGNMTAYRETYKVNSF